MSILEDNFYKNSMEEREIYYNHQGLMDSLLQGKLLKNLSSGYRQNMNNGLKKYDSSNTYEGINKNGNRKHSIVEGFETYNKVNQKDGDLEAELMGLKYDFDNKLNEYINTYGEFLDETNVERRASLKISVNNLKSELNMLAEAIQGKTSSMSNDYKAIVDKNILVNNISTLNNKRELLNKVTEQNNSLKENYDENMLRIRSNYYQYLAWTIGAVTLGAVLFKKITE